VFGFSLYTILGIVLTIGVFLLLREFVGWYWKINSRDKHQAEMTSELKKIRVLLERSTGIKAPSGAKKEERPQGTWEDIKKKKN